jgi:hypothetical protein
MSTPVNTEQSHSHALGDQVALEALVVRMTEASSWRARRQAKR